MMLIYLKYIVHVVETSSDMIMKIVQDLQMMEQDPDSYVAKSKILVISHDINIRLYSYWSFQTLDIIEHGIEAYDTHEPCENLIVDLLTQILKLGVYLFKQPKTSLRSAMETLHEKIPDLLPQQSIVNYLLEENDSSMITPDEFINMYKKPFDTSLESDMVWPIPARLFPYN
uniref:BLUF domain-containing protein n=1 Tax=Arion vulgaris TaxID=1028688 RepID=A0A0B6Z9H9_9EUPU